MYELPNNIKIIVKAEGKEIELTMPWDSNTTDWYDAFFTIMTWLTFTSSQIKTLLTNPEDK